MSTKTKLTIASILLVGAFVVSAGAEERRDEYRGADRRDDRGHERSWGSGGYYPAPPVVYGQPNYYPPPVVYGPAVGIYVPGLSIGIR